MMRIVAFVVEKCPWKCYYYPMGEKKSGKTRWHRLLGKFFEELLSPYGVSVLTEFPIMSESPEVDILLMRRQQPLWTKKQRDLLPDGVRDSHAKHILLEFKYTESIDDGGFRQALGYDTFYKRSHQMGEYEVQTFIVSAKTTRWTLLKSFGYSPTKHPGVYKSENRLLKSIPLLCLNELSDAPHNAFIKCFSSQKKEKEKAFNILKRQWLGSLSRRFQWFLAGLFETWFPYGGDVMEVELTPEKVMKMGKKWGEAYLSGLPPKERLAGLDPAERLAGLDPAERLAGLTVKEIENYLRKKKRVESKLGGSF